MYRDTFFKSFVILNTCTMDTHLCVARHWKKVFRYTIYVLGITKKKYWHKARYTTYVSVIPQFSTGGTQLCVARHKKKVFSLSAIHNLCIGDTPNQRTAKKSRPVMIHPPYTHQSIDAYIIHVPAITDYHYLTSHYPWYIISVYTQYMVLISQDTDIVCLFIKFFITLLWFNSQYNNIQPMLPLGNR